MNYKILSLGKTMESVGDLRPLTGSIFFTTDRTIGRDPQLISEALRRIDPSFFAFDGDPKRFDRPHQTHTDRILPVTEAFFSLSEKERKAQMEGIDAVVSDVRNVCLGISTADCIPVLVYDKVHHCAAAIHAGWRGTVVRIVEKAIGKMQELYATVPEQCEAVIGPGISQQSFEVGWEVHKAFEEAGFPMQDVTVVMPSSDGNGSRPHLDLKEINRLQLLAAGIMPENISVSAIDTFTDTRFFSARREQKGTEKCGRILSGFILS